MTVMYLFVAGKEDKAENVALLWSVFDLTLRRLSGR